MIQRFVLYGSLCVLLLSTSAAFAQTIPFTERQKWDGPYDIKMIAAPNLEAVFIDSANALNFRLKKDSVISNQNTQRTWNRLNINNKFKTDYSDNDPGESPFAVIEEFPVPALACKDLNAPCFTGLIKQSNNSSCPAPANRYSSSPGTVRRYVSMSYADYDTDFSTYSSSMSRLEGIPQCSQVEAAYLYWTGNVFTGTGNNENPDITLVPTGSYNGSGNVFKVTDSSGFNKVLLKRPGGIYQTVTADTTYRGPRDYVCVAEVTDLIKGAGLGDYWVGNIQSYPIDDDGGSTSGWTLVIVSRSPLSPPRSISLWDGFLNVKQNQSTVITMKNLQAPATNDFKSYVGYAMLDGENIASEISSSAVLQDYLGFSTVDSLQSSIRLNPFAENPEYSYKRFTSNGLPALVNGDRNVETPTSCNIPSVSGQGTVFDGISSSKISSYNDVDRKNGAPLKRLPDNNNTLGYDSHHLLLPDGSVTPNATFASLFVNAGPQGSTKPFMAYLAIERIQPKLIIAKSVDTSFTRTEDVVNFRIRVINTGNDISLGEDSVYDVLDEGVDYVPGSFNAKSFKNGVASAAIADSVTLLSSKNDSLQFKIHQKILPNDSIEINFQVKVKDFENNKNLWLEPGCKRTIPYIAYVVYNTKNTVRITNASNALDCGPVSSASILVVDRKFDVTPDSVGTYDATLFRDEKVAVHIKDVLVNKAKKITDPQFADFRIYDSAFVLVTEPTIFPDSGKSVTYYAIRDNIAGGGCQTKYKIRFILGIPKIFIDTIRINNLCSGSFVSNPILTMGDYAAYSGNLTVLSQFTVFPKHGKIDVDSVANSYRYDPAPGFVGKDTVIFRIRESVKSETVDKPMYIVVNNVNKPPVVKQNLFTTYRNQTISSFNVLGNTSDPNGDGIYLIPSSDDQIYQDKLTATYKKNDSIFFKNYASDFHQGDRVYYGRKANFTRDSIVLKPYNKLVDSVRVQPKRGTLTINVKGEFTYVPDLDEGKDAPVRDTAVFWICDYSTKTYCNPFFCRLDTVVFEIKPYRIFIPEGFSPNNDGINDFFFIDAEVPVKAHIMVYNRWGSLVYENKEYKNDWDGKANKGVVIGDGVPDGTYYVYVNVNDKEVEQFRYITINR